MESTLALIKPDAVHRADEILTAAQEAGFVILQKRRVHLSQEQASEFYAEHFGKAFFANLISFMGSGPIVAAVLSKPGAVQGWRDLLGPTDSTKARSAAPTSIRARFGTDGTRNAAHGSDSVASAHREIRFFFPEMIVDPLPTPDQARDYITRTVTPTLVKALSALCKTKPANPTVWLADWLVANNPNRPVISQP
eukprot:m.15007 g.15007  ORF g.15007 m.15007 type:complete len:195 (+) comp6575_c0_seq1:151-735(+)